MKAISSIKQNAHMNTHSSSTVAVPPPNQKFTPNQPSPSPCTVFVNCLNIIHLQALELQMIFYKTFNRTSELNQSQIDFTSKLIRASSAFPACRAHQNSTQEAEYGQQCHVAVTHHPSQTWTSRLRISPFIPLHLLDSFSEIFREIKNNRKKHRPL